MTTGVYIVWRKGVALYIGSSVNCYRRVRFSAPKELGRIQAFLESDEVSIHPCDSLRQARQLEVELIGIYRPRYNRNDHLQSTRNFQQLQAMHARVFDTPEIVPTNTTVNN